ncbi:hypothetical protein HDU86_004478 [Geranomyces michiganensis]|nr:hypothetical protein HDU86_004478 [Geranomyces michiganensis]
MDYRRTSLRDKQQLLDVNIHDNETRPRPPGLYDCERRPSTRPRPMAFTAAEERGKHQQSDLRKGQRHPQQRYAPPPPKPVLAATYDRPAGQSSSSIISLATTKSSSDASARTHVQSVNGSRRGGGSSNKSAGSSSTASHLSKSSSRASRNDEDEVPSAKRETSFVKLKRSASSMSVKMKRKFSGKSVFDAALAHGSSTQLHVSMPDSLHSFTAASSSTTNLSSTLSSHFGSGSTSYSSAQISPSGAYKIARALLASGSPSLAIPHLHQAAANGHVKAQYTIGVIHTHGVPGNMRPNLQLASTYYRLAAIAGYPPAQCNLGVMYAEGQGGLPRDVLVAREWFRKSAEGGYPEGMWNLARTAWQCGDLKDARRWFARAGESGCVGAERYLRVLKTEREADRHYADVWKGSPLRDEQIGEPVPRNIRSRQLGGWDPHPAGFRREAAVAS